MGRTVVSATIANGTSLSGEVNTNDKRIAGVIMPSSGWTAAALNAEALQDSSGNPPTNTFKPLVDTGGAEVTITTGGDRYIAIPESHGLGVRGLGRIKLRSGTSAVPVNQLAERIIKLVLVD